MKYTSFDQEYAKLNQNQKQAVDEVYGPVMVVAGPGTGKTQIIGLRTANIILKTGINPENILITTFTESGVVAIRKRLLDFIGTDAYKVAVSTIHSFAQEVIKTFPEKFIEYKASVLSDDVETLEILTLILNEGIEKKELEHLVNDFNPHFYIRDIKSNISILKQEGIDKARFEHLIEKQAENYVQELAEIKPTLKKYEITKEKQEKHIAKLKEFIHIFEQYNAYLRTHQKYDFNDMIQFVLEKISNDEELRYYYAEKYQFIMLDEYQDTNNAQNEIINLILGVARDDGREPNIMVVGDDDQSIYRFQGANIENMLDFSLKYPNTKFIVLKDNYRSNQGILDLSTALIKNNQERLVNKIPHLEKMLFAAGKYKNISKKPKLLRAMTVRDEQNFILERINEIHPSPALPFQERGKNSILPRFLDNVEKETQFMPPSPERGGVGGGVSYNDIAIIVRNNKEVAEYTQFLQQNGIPAESKLKSDILSSPYVQFILNYLRVVANPYAYEEKLIDIMRTNILGLNQIDILKLNRALYRANYTRKWKLYMIDFLADENALLEAGISNKDALIAFRDNLLNVLGTQLKELNFIEFFNAFIKNSQILEYVEKNGTFDDIEDIFTLFNTLKNFTLQIPNFSLEKLFTKLDLYATYNYPIPRQILKKQGSGVQVMTAHGSKGLEFEVVFVPGVYYGNWENKRIVEKIKLPALVGEGLQNTQKEDQIEEDRRLFFVAVTRAKDELYISYPLGSGTKPLLPSIFIEEIQGQYEEIILENTVSDTQSFPSSSLYNTIKNTLQNSLIHYTDAEFDYIQEFLQDYKISPSDLNIFIEDPKEFLNRVVFKYPFIDNQYTIFGKVYHHTLELFYLKLKKEGILPSKKYLTDMFVFLLDKEVLTPDEKEKLTQKGVDGLSGYYDLSAHKKEENIECEYSFRHRNIVFEGIPLTGTIDKIQKIDTLMNANNFGITGQGALFTESIALVDYKTGSSKSVGEIKGLDRLGNKKPGEGKYFRQLLFYKLLCEHDRELSAKFSVGSLAIDFVEGKDGVYKYVDIEFTPEEYEYFKQELADAWAKIQDIEFWKGVL